LTALISTLTDNGLDVNDDFLPLLFNTIPYPIFFKSLDGVYLLCNDAYAQEIHGVSKEYLIGKTMFDLPEHISHEEALFHLDKDNQLISTQEPLEYEADVVCSDQSPKHYKIHKRLMIDRWHQVLGIIGTMHDITDITNYQIELAQTNVKLMEMSNRDPLTQLYNRRMFDELFEKILYNCKRHQNVFNFAIIDIDFFKQYNDTFGHVKGDELLKFIANILDHTMSRKDDYSFRLGGDEFAVIFSTDTFENAYKLIEKVKNEIFDLNIVFQQSDNKISSSIGLISVSNDYSLSEDYIYAEADKLLYEAKNAGKNQIVCSNF
jgi:diguanylate cyclase (GGDEF)-like protein/PAS domain S-box-containing protein